MEPGKSDQTGWRLRTAWVAKAALPYGFAVAGLALGVAAVVENEPLAGACGAVAGVTAGLIQLRRAHTHRDHVAALRDRLRAQRAESEQVTAQLRQTVSALQTDVWQHRMVALATPAYGLPQLSPAGAAATRSAWDEPTAVPTPEPKPEPLFELKQPAAPEPIAKPEPVAAPEPIAEPAPDRVIDLRDSRPTPAVQAENEPVQQVARAS